MDDIEKFVKAFIKKDFRERFLFIVDKRPIDLSRLLAHNLEHYIERKYFRLINKKLQYPEFIINALASKGAPESCTIVSQDPDLHKKCCLLADATPEIFYGKESSIVICIPDKLAYYEAEEIHDRYLIMK